MTLFKLIYLSLIPTGEICGVIMEGLEGLGNRRCQDTLELFLSSQLLRDFGYPFNWI